MEPKLRTTKFVLCVSCLWFLSAVAVVLRKEEPAVKTELKSTLCETGCVYQPDNEPSPCFEDSRVDGLWQSGGAKCCGPRCKLEFRSDVGWYPFDGSVERMVGEDDPGSLEINDASFDCVDDKDLEIQGRYPCDRLSTMNIAQIKEKKKQEKRQLSDAATPHSNTIPGDGLVGT
eukprot:GILK01011341.1.p1 GENE.GILK01011341.1~~GILK01011341.1.p1  ORF type:complete len:174 (-),score=25.36 GILK01011341.1:138-659(-)